MSKTFNHLKKILYPYRISLVIVVITAILSAGFSIVTPKFLGNATTVIYDGLINQFTNNGGIDFNRLKDILLGIVYFYIISMLFSTLQGILMSIVNQKITYDLREKIVQKINKIPLKYYEERQTGDILSIITNDVDIISESIDQSFTELIRSLSLLIGIVIMMFSINILMSLIIFLIMPLIGALLKMVIEKSQNYFVKQQENVANLNAHVEEMYSAHSVIKVYGADEHVISSFKDTNETLYSTEWLSQFFGMLMMPIMDFIGNLSYVIISIFGGWLVIIGQLVVGDILAFTQYTRTFMQPIRSISQMIPVLQQLAAASDRVFSFLNAEEEQPDQINKYNETDIQGDVVFKDVSFTYNDNEMVLNNININVKSGSKVAIVGPTGAGKTTIVKLLMRFYDATTGTITINNININELRKSDLRNSFGMVLQDAWLANTTVLENIRFGNLKASDEEVYEAAKLSYVDHFVKTLPEGYNTLLSEEANNISMGQKQLLTIARVMLKDPKFLILDEATSNVDTRTEILIQEAISKLMKDKTSFIIAHRLSTIKSADLILVINEGNLIEQGTHEQLLKKNGFYTNLYNSQFQDQ